MRHGLLRYGSTSGVIANFAIHAALSQGKGHPLEKRVTTYCSTPKPEGALLYWRHKNALNAQEHRMALHTWLIYLVAALGLSLTPGPNSLLALTHGALHGHRRTLFTVAGGALGFVMVIALSMAGIGALLQASANALVVLKWVGGAYLVWLGIQLWRAPPLQLKATGDLPCPRRSQLFRQGLFAAISNPKALLFYGAFLPQFLDPTRSLWLQFVVMAGTFAVIECGVEYLLARLANRIRPALERLGQRFNRICGGAFATMGVALPLTR